MDINNVNPCYSIEVAQSGVPMVDPGVTGSIQTRATIFYQQLLLVGILLYS